MNFAIRLFVVECMPKHGNWWLPIDVRFRHEEAMMVAEEREAEGDAVCRVVEFWRAMEVPANYQGDKEEWECG